jgi:HEAT repeat protein
MDLKALLDTPPWDWPGDAGNIFWRILLDRRAKESDRLIAAELAGDFTVINDDLADALLMIANSANELEQLRSRAAISLGPVLEQADTDGFEDPEDVPITEPMFRTIQESLEKLYLDNNTPKEVRRRSLEASVRAPQVWHQAAIEQAYSSGDKEWMLTAVFSMCWVRGFDEQILLALKSSDPEIKYEAVVAAGNWGLDAAWSPIVELLNDGLSPKPLLLAAIGAIGSIRANEAPEILVDLADSDDEEIAQAVVEALATDDSDLDEEDEDDEQDKWVN